MCTSYLAFELLNIVMYRKVRKRDDIYVLIFIFFPQL